MKRSKNDKILGGVLSGIASALGVSAGLIRVVFLVGFFAIGGIGATNVAAVQAAGGQRVAVVRAITAAADPGAATRALLQALGQCH